MIRAAMLASLILAAALAAGVHLGAVGQAQGTAGSWAIGDANCDSSVNATDALLVLQLDANLIASLGCPANTDANSDGMTNALDAALILQYDAGLIGTLPPPRPHPTATPTPCPCGG
jgi:hypothetical protein